MKKFLYLFMILSFCSNVMAQGVFDSMEAASEVKLTPSIKTTDVKNLEVPAADTSLKAPAPITSAVKAETPAVADTTTPAIKNQLSIKEQKFNNALTNLDDAQVELRQELAALNAKYTEALDEKEKILLNCRNLKKEIKDINTKMKNVEKSKKMINKTLDNPQ